MAAVSLTGNDTIMLNNQVLTGLATGTCVELTFPNEMASVKTGKNGNSIYALNTTGRQSELKVHLLRGCADDVFLNNLLVQQDQNFAGTVLVFGQFTKKIGDGSGNITSDTYTTSGGVFTKRVEAKTNVEGDTEQSIVVYTLKFSNTPRTIG